MKNGNYLKQIITCAENYRQFLLDKSILFVYCEGKKIKWIEVEFRKNNFAHLTGIKTHLRPSDFFANCINHKLDINSYKTTSYTSLKLSTFTTLVHIPEISAVIGDYNGTNTYLQLDIVVAKHQMVLGLSKGRNKFYYPKTLLKEGNHFAYMKNQNPILLTCIKNIGSIKTDYALSYANKKSDVGKIISALPQKIKYSEKTSN